MTTTELGARSIPYHKILGPYKRDTDRNSPTYNKVLPGAWTTPEFAYLAGEKWLWTEKVDGTNVRVHWDGTTVEFAGRTDRAELPPRLLERLEAHFPVELVEQQFGDAPTTLYGEGYGGKIQKGGKYRTDESFILFDVKVDTWWLEPHSVADIAATFMVPVVPRYERMTVFDAIGVVRCGVPSQLALGERAEGLVGTPAVPLFTRSGGRIIMKVKTADFYDPSSRRTHDSLNALPTVRAWRAHMGDYDRAT